MNDGEIKHDDSTIEHFDQMDIESPGKRSIQSGDTRPDVMEDSPVVEKENLSENMKDSRQNTTFTTVHDDVLDDVIHLRAKKDGIQNSLKSITFLAKMMIPMSVMALVMFALFSLMSWLIPHVLCKSFGESLSVRSQQNACHVCVANMSITGILFRAGVIDRYI